MYLPTLLLRSLHTCKPTPLSEPPPPPYLWHPPQPCSPSYSHDGQSCLRRHKLQHGGQRTPGCARWPLFLVHQTLQGPRCQQLTQLGQHRLRATVIHLEGGKKTQGHRQRCEIRFDKCSGVTLCYPYIVSVTRLTNNKLWLKRKRGCGSFSRAHTTAAVYAAHSALIMEAAMNNGCSLLFLSFKYG